MSPVDALAILALATFAGTAHAITGFGFGLLIVPPLVLLFGPHDAVALSTVLGTALSATLLPSVRRDIAWPPLKRATVAAIIASPLGLAALVWLDRDALQATIAVAVLIATFLLVRGIRVPVEPNIGPAVAGFAAGIARMAAGLPGPPVVLYLQAAGFSPAAHRATITAFFVITGIAGVLLFAVEGSLDIEMAALTGAGLPGVLVGGWAGERLFARVSSELFSNLVYGLLVASALTALGGAIL